MDKKNMNRRQRMTVRLLEEAYLELLTEKREANVAVLCEQADVNRTTFYRYFRDIEDLSEQMTAGLFDEIFSALDEIGNAGTSANKKILRALDVTEKNGKLCRHLLSDSHTDLAVVSLEEHLTLLKETVLSTGCAPEAGELCYGSVCGGIARLWVKWIAGGFAAPKEQVAELVEEMILRFYGMLESGVLL